jgi:hypothetical protein
MELSGQDADRSYEQVNLVNNVSKILAHSGRAERSVRGEGRIREMVGKAPRTEVAPVAQTRSVVLPVLFGVVQVHRLEDEMDSQVGQRHEANRCQESVAFESYPRVGVVPDEAKHRTQDDPADDRSGPLEVNSFHGVSPFLSVSFYPPAGIFPSPGTGGIPAFGHTGRDIGG